MSKELIVSVNGREKKIAIIENGKVTEFYIERGEGGQGIVGNIYKGRVMRVLPGMQSAFVDIGLERDAFLYVSDFFDEEEEFERIVIDKSKTEVTPGAPAVSPVRLAAEEIAQARFDRELQIEAVHEQHERVVTTEVGEEEDARTIAGPAARRPDGRPDERGRGRRRGGREAQASSPQQAKAPPLTPSLPSSAEEAVEPDQPRAGMMVAPNDEGRVLTPFIAEKSSFQRIVDEEERAAGEGEMLKDAMLQERIFDQIHAIEFDMEAASTVPVDSLFTRASESQFQRIEDPDYPSGMTSEARGADSFERVTSASSAASSLDETSTKESAVASSFERISDDERDAEKSLERSTSSRPEEARRTANGRRRSATKAEAAQTAPGPESGTGEGEEESPKRGTRSRPSATGKTASTKRSTAAGRKSTAGERKRGTKVEKAVATVDASAQENAGGDALANDNSGELFDAEASITGPRSRAEFARRGGRRRRRPSNQAAEGSAESAVAEEERVDGGEPAVTGFDIVEEESAPKVSVPKAAAPRSADVPPSPGPRVSNSPQRSGNAPGNSGPGNGRAAHPAQHAAGTTTGSRGRRGDRPPQPTITDLLREGQEILVQIAKEPIAQKGARITSHIALPGRFLVYMPTVEHVGVSRKIESDSERVRLRKLIQAIRAEEDVPSGGFIVRTAGVGIIEAELREDARYLVRTWRDIRRTAERGKAPVLVHRDLDLVQRILRDQLSEDFTAIRVDSEDEYQEIVEFVNRIQPRLVNRVKLYTRDEPILDAFGVQAEVEKAIKPRVWLRSGGYLVINQTEALVAIDVNTGKFVGRGGSRLEDTITKTNMEAVEEIARQIRLRDLGGILVLDLIDMEERRNRQRVMTALQDALKDDKSPTKLLSFNDFGLVIMTRKRVKQSLERTLCSPCPYCQGSSLVKSPQTICYEILEEARRLARGLDGDIIKQATLRVNPEVARTLRSSERDVLTEIEVYLGAIDVTSDAHVHQEQFDFAFL